jgi:hypothetical protein
MTPLHRSIVTGLLLMAALPAHAAQWQFDVFLDGHRIGEHTFTIERLGNDRYVARSNARFDVKVMWIPVFRYRHESVEQWQGDCLDSIESRTRVNDERYRLDGSRQGNEFDLAIERDGSREQRSLPACVATYAYWDARTLRQHAHLLNSQTGSYDAVSLERLATELRIVGEHSGDRFAIDVDYGDGRWEGLTTQRDGRRIEYRLR